MNKIYIEGLEVRPCLSTPSYGTSSCGEVFRLDKKKKMTKTYRVGYYYVRTCENAVSGNARVNIMVAEAWVENPNPELYIQVNHKNGNKLDNRAENLEWCSRSQNQRHAIQTDLKGRGETLYNSSFSEEDAHKICQLLVDGLTVKDIATKFGVSRDCIRKIRAGDTWFHVRRLYPIEHKYKNTFSEGTIKWVCNQIVQGYSDKDIRDMSTNKNITIIEVKRIREKMRFKGISDAYF